MGNAFRLSRRILGSSCILELTAAEHASILGAKNNLIRVLYIEEKMEYVLENLMELERDLLNVSLNNFRVFNKDWTHSVGETHLISRRIVNLLASGRQYLDHASHDLGAIFGNNSAEAKELKQKKSEQYDTKFGYQVMEAMRNFTLHRGLPISGLSLDASWDDPNSPMKTCGHICVPYITVEALEEESKFKASVLAKLRLLDNKIDVRPLIRQYAAGIGEVHICLRKLLEPHIPAWESELEIARQRFESECNEGSVGLALQTLDESGVLVSSTDLFDDFVKRRKLLEKKNRMVTHFAWHYASGNAPHPGGNQSKVEADTSLAFVKGSYELQKD